MTAQLPYQLFVSYSQNNRGWVEGYLLDALQAAGVRVLSQLNFVAGAPRIAEFERAVTQCERTLLVLSPAYIAEAGMSFLDVMVQHYGLESGVWPVIPLILEPVALPPRLAFLVALDATDVERWPEAVARLCQAVQAGPPLPASRPPCPYPGMRAFRREEAPQFYGRESEVADLLQRLRLHPFVAIIGASGSGKSSLVSAGLLPALQRSTLFGAGGWLVRTFRPGAQPLAAMQTALGGVELEQFTPAPLLVTEKDAARVLLVIDQFEELFTQSADQVETFCAAIQRFVALRDCYLVMTVRADFFGDLLSSALWPLLQAHRLEIAPLSADGLRAAIVKPAEDKGVFIESALVERLVAGSVGQPGLLPFVQEVLVRLWDKLERRYLPLSAYEALVLPLAGYSGKGRSGIQAAMAQLADEMIDRLPEDQQRIARRIFLRLVQFGEGRDNTRRQQPVSALRAAGDAPARFDATLNYLVENRLLVLSGDTTGEPRVDLAHEAMLTGWPRLEGWVIAHREAELARRQLEVRSVEWLRLSRKGGLLDEYELAILDQNVQSAAIQYELSTTAHEFFTRSQDMAARRRRRRKIIMALGVVVLLMIGCSISYMLGDYVHIRILQSQWREVGAPAGALSAVDGEGEQAWIGSYDYGISGRGQDGEWTDWMAVGLPHSTPSTSTDDPAASIRSIYAVEIDSISPYTVSAWVVDAGIFQWRRESEKWEYIGEGVPVNSLAQQPLAAYNGTVLAVADDLGVYIRPNGKAKWQNLADTEPSFDQQFFAVAFTSDGMPYVSGKSGLFRGSGNYPWQWEEIASIPEAHRFVLDEKQNIYAVLQPDSSGARPLFACFDADGNAIGDVSQLPVSDWLLSFVQPASIDSIVSLPGVQNGAYVADNFGAVYEATCDGEWTQIGQRPVTESVPSRLAIQHSPDSSDLLLWASRAGLQQRTIE